MTTRDDLDASYGNIAIKYDYITAMQLVECLQLKNLNKQEGKEAPSLSSILIQKGYLTEEQNQEILRIHASLKTSNTKQTPSKIKMVPEKELLINSEPSAPLNSSLEKNIEIPIAKEGKNALPEGIPIPAPDFLLNLKEDVGPVAQQEEIEIIEEIDEEESPSSNKNSRDSQKEDDIILNLDDITNASLKEISQVTPPPSPPEKNKKKDEFRLIDKLENEEEKTESPSSKMVKGTTSPAATSATPPKISHKVTTQRRVHIIESQGKVTAKNPKVTPQSPSRGEIEKANPKIAQSDIVIGPDGQKKRHCPYCGELNSITFTRCRLCNENMNGDDKLQIVEEGKRCPICDTEIHPKALKCSHCRAEFCKYCYSLLDPTSITCGECGKQIRAKPLIEAKKQTKYRESIIGIASTVVGIILLVIVVSALFGTKPKKTTTPVTPLPNEVNVKKKLDDMNSKIERGEEAEKEGESRVAFIYYKEAMSILQDIKKIVSPTQSEWKIILNQETMLDDKIRELENKFKE